MNKINLHKSIDNLPDTNIDSVVISPTIKLILEDKQYFYVKKANKNWFEWLVENNFLDPIKQKGADQNNSFVNLPELEYLQRVAPEKETEVADFICSFSITSKYFNPLVVDHFLRITANLNNVKLIQKIVPKIKKENWVKLMAEHRQYGFEYEKIIKKLKDANDTKSILDIAEIITQTKPKPVDSKYSYADNPFYVSEIGETKVFQTLANIDNQFQERALSICAKCLKAVLEYDSDYLFVDEDFFNFNIENIQRDTFNEETKLIGASTVRLIHNLFSDNSTNPQEIYAKYLSKLPKKRTSQRIQLYALSQNPKIFQKELKDKLFSIFTIKNPYEILYGAEYEQTLITVFEAFDKKTQTEYKNSLFKYFGKFDSKNNEDKTRKLHYGSCLLSSIFSYLSKQEIKTGKEIGFHISSKYKPEPTVLRSVSGTVESKSPVSFTEYSVETVVTHLKADLSPSELSKKYKDDYFLTPRDADGVAEELKQDISRRLDDYLNSADLFFNREEISPHYTYSFLYGIKEAIKDDAGNINRHNFSNLFGMFSLIMASNINKPLVDEEQVSRWLSGWNTVHIAITDLLETLLTKKDPAKLNFPIYADRIYTTIEYLLNHPSPTIAQETNDPLITEQSNGKSTISDPFSIAINSVRGRAFQVFLHFVYQESSQIGGQKLSERVRNLYNSTLEKEGSRSIMFMFGHYLPTFYFRNMDWTRERFTKIFADPNKDELLRLAAWEGYLSGNLYEHLFFEEDIQSLYLKNIANSKVYPNQKFFREPSIALATHLALAFVYYKVFDEQHKLFKEFVAKGSEEQIAEFVRFIGSSCIAGENNEILTRNEKNIEKIMKLWKFIIRKFNNPIILQEFGTWIDLEHQVFDTEWLAKQIKDTLIKSYGRIRWSLGLAESIDKFAEVSPKNALEIIELFFLDQIKREKYFKPLEDDKTWYQAIKIIYSKGQKEEVAKLINKLIEAGGRAFWKLEEIIKNN